MYILLLTFYPVAFLYLCCYTSLCSGFHPEGVPQNGMTVNGWPRKCRARIADRLVRSCARKERKRERERPTWPAPKSWRDTNVREYKWIRARAKAGTRHPLVVAISSWWNFTPSGAGHLPRPSVTIILTAIFSCAFKGTPSGASFHFFFFFSFRNALRIYRRIRAW